MSAVIEVHGKYTIARAEERGVRRHVGHGAGVRLHVGVLGSEQQLHPVDGQLFSLIYIFAAAVVPLVRIPFRVLIREDRSCCLHYRGTAMVLGSDKHDVLELAMLLASDDG